MSVAWASVKDHFVTGLPAIVGASVKVYDGPVATKAAPSAYITVGHAPSAADASAGTFAQDVAPDGFRAAETGTVICELAAVTGSTDVPSVFATFALIAAWVQSDMSLGGLLAVNATCTTSANVVQAQTRSGATQRLLLTVQYSTWL